MRMRTGVPSGSGNSLERSAGSQKRRNRFPIGVPGPTRVMVSKLSLFTAMLCLLLLIAVGFASNFGLNNLRKLSAAFCLQSGPSRQLLPKGQVASLAALSPAILENHYEWVQARKHRIG